MQRVKKFEFYTTYDGTQYRLPMGISYVNYSGPSWGFCVNRPKNGKEDRKQVRFNQMNSMDEDDAFWQAVEHLKKIMLERHPLPLGIRIYVKDAGSFNKPMTGISLIRMKGKDRLDEFSFHIGLYDEYGKSYGKLLYVGNEGNVKDCYDEKLEIAKTLRMESLEREWKRQFALIPTRG